MVPIPKKVIVFFDGQNLYHGAKDAWHPHKGSEGIYSWPSYDVELLAQFLVNRQSGRELEQIRFYTGIPHPIDESKKFWRNFWFNKLKLLEHRGVYVYRGRINKAGREKGVDVKLSVDLIESTYEERYDVAIIVSQDWDFSPAVHLARKLVNAQGRNVQFESAFPVGPGSHSNRGIPDTTWTRISKAEYDSCVDTRDYR